jgi:outer membrane protein assembly factor BamB
LQGPKKRVKDHRDGLPKPGPTSAFSRPRSHFRVHIAYYRYILKKKSQLQKSTTRPPRLFRTALTLCLFLTAVASSADWPHVRGPSYDAISRETGLVDRWPGAGPPVLWTRELGPGYSAFIVAAGKAFTLFQTIGGMFLIALDADTGAEIWKERVDWPWKQGGMYAGPYASPTWYDGKVFYATPTGLVGCVGAAYGHSYWTVNVREKFGSRGTEFGFASTPTVEDGRVILPVGGPNAAMVALSVTDGSTLWASGDDPASYCPAYPITLDGRRLVVGFFQNSLILFDAKTGERVWRERLSSSYDEHAAWPLFDGRHLLIASPFRVGSQLFRFNTSESGITTKTIWRGQQLSNDVCSSILIDGSVYGFDIQQLQASTQRESRGALKCLDFLTGKIRWETSEAGQSSILLADGRLILWTETGVLILAKPNPDHYEELARAKVLSGGGMCWSAPALSGKRLIVRNHKKAVCLYLGPPSELDPARPTYTLTAEDTGFNWTRLVPKEPDFPNDAPSAAEIAIWFAWCAGILTIAALGAIALGKLIRRLNPRAVFVFFAFSLGAIGTTVIGTCFDTFVWTWPVSLYIAFLGVIALGLDRAAHGWRHQIFARLALILFIAFCFGYYRFCMAVGYAMGWGFLFGLAPAMPFGVIANRIANHKLRWLLDGLGFVVYFWSSGLIPACKAAWGG